MENLAELRAREEEVAREWQWLHETLNEVARVRAEYGDAAAFRLMQAQAMKVGQSDRTFAADCGDGSTACHWAAPAMMVYRKGELHKGRIDREWPHQVALRADAVSGANFPIVDGFSRRLSRCERGHSFVRDGQDYVVYCFRGEGGCGGISRTLQRRNHRPQGSPALAGLQTTRMIGDGDPRRLPPYNGPRGLQVLPPAGALPIGDAHCRLWRIVRRDRAAGASVERLPGLPGPYWQAGLQRSVFCGS